MNDTQLSDLHSRLTALERQVTRYRSAFVFLVLIMAGAMLVGATTDEVQDVLKTKKLVVLNEAGRIAFAAGSATNGEGYLKINSQTGEELVYAGAVLGGHGTLVISSKEGERIVDAGGM